MKSVIHYSSLKLKNLERYLDYLIEYGIIKYDGVNHLFTIRERDFIFTIIILSSRKKHFSSFINLMIILESVRDESLVTRLNTYL